MKNVCLIGYGIWGKKVLKALKKIKSIKKIHVIKSKSSKNKINFNNLDWVIIATNNNSHYKLVRKFLNLKINIFCEKPLTLNPSDDLKLYALAKKNNCKLYVSDVENYKKKNLSILKENFIERSKFSQFKKDIIYRLVYHDFTYLYKYIKEKKISIIKIIKSKQGELNFKIRLKRKIFNFKYSLNLKKKKHKFNNVNLITKKNVLEAMLAAVVNNKVSLGVNKKISIFANRMCNKIKIKVKKI